MTKREYEAIVGALLHDIGKVIYRTGERKTHSKSGYDFLKDEIGIQDQEILNSVLYHHGSALHNAKIAPDSLAYITYIADNIASGADRRKKENEDYGFEMTLPLQPVFNILNQNKQDMYYHPMFLDEHINYPTDQKIPFSEGFYSKVKMMLKDAIIGIDWTKEYVNSLLAALEMGLSYVPSSTAKGEVADISLYDHVKLTAAVSSCIYQYLFERNIQNFKTELFEHSIDFYQKDVFLLLSIDLSGIQSFIYTIHSKDALKMLRTRSFYLEIMMENIIDDLLDLVSLSRANLIYSGGGHSYMLVPNTKQVKDVIREYEQQLNQWFLENYDVALFAAFAYAPASANTLKNDPDGSYENLFHNVSNQLGEKKLNRYSPRSIMALNQQKSAAYDRECRICKRMEHVNEEGVCTTCCSLIGASRQILYAPFFVVVKNRGENALPLPGNTFLIAETEQQLRERMRDYSDSFVRAYAKNKFYTGLKIATRIWVGNYTKGQSFEELAAESVGIKRLGVLRADVDNLGQAFVSGFSHQYSTISRTAVLSRQLSIFFKYYINHLLEERSIHLYDTKDGTSPHERNVTIVYSGGDDLFLVGAWNEVVEFGMELTNAWRRYTEETLSISAGIGIYESGFPVHQMAVEVGGLEDDSKLHEGKNAVTVLPDGEQHWEKEGTSMETSVSDGTYSWNEFEKEVIGEKYEQIRSYFDNTNDHGKAFLYHILELIRNRKEKINFARYVYLLSRMEPDKNASKKEQECYRAFSEQMYEWMKSPKDSRQLKTAITIYTYLTREKEDTGNDNK